MSDFENFLVWVWIWCGAIWKLIILFRVDGRWKASINRTNKMGSAGALATAFATLLHQMRQGELPYLTPTVFRVCIFSSS